MKDPVEVFATVCPACGSVRAYKKDDTRLAIVVCTQCFRGDVQPLAINFEQKRFETPS